MIFNYSRTQFYYNHIMLMRFFSLLRKSYNYFPSCRIFEVSHYDLREDVRNVTLLQVHYKVSQEFIPLTCNVGTYQCEVGM